MPNPVLIHRIAPKNILSFGRENPGIELRALNVLIGPNGSGKSNLIETIALMRASPADWQDVTRAGGGVGEWIWKGAGPPPKLPLEDFGTDRRVARVGLTFEGVRANAGLVHEFAFQEIGGRFDLVEEKIHDEAPPGGMEEGYYSTAFGYEGPQVARRIAPGKRQWEQVRLRSDRSVLAFLRDASAYPELTLLAETYERVRIYREWTFGRNAILRSPQRTDLRNDVLEEDFSNLWLILNRMRKSPIAKKAVVDHLRKLYDALTDFEVVAEGGIVQAFLHEGEFSIPATRLSDGTLRYLGLLAILCDPEPPPLICIEEPEIGLHPDILPGLSDLLREASERTQIIVTTHSDILVDTMTETPEAVIVCEKHDGKTEMNRLSAKELAVWLEKYRLGQLWIEGQLGGKRW